jgi:hypothetical protein
LIFACTHKTNTPRERHASTQDKPRRLSFVRRGEKEMPPPTRPDADAFYSWLFALSHRLSVLISASIGLLCFGVAGSSMAHGDASDAQYFSMMAAALFGLAAMNWQQLDCSDGRTTGALLVLATTMRLTQVLMTSPPALKAWFAEWQASTLPLARTAWILAGFLSAFPPLSARWHIFTIFYPLISGLVLGLILSVRLKDWNGLLFFTPTISCFTVAFVAMRLCIVTVLLPLWQKNEKLRREVIRAENEAQQLRAEIAAQRTSERTEQSDSLPSTSDDRGRAPHEVNGPKGSPPAMLGEEDTAVHGVGAKDAGAVSVVDASASHAADQPHGYFQPPPQSVGVPAPQGFGPTGGEYIRATLSGHSSTTRSTMRTNTPNGNTTLATADSTRYTNTPPRSNSTTTSLLSRARRRQGGNLQRLPRRRRAARSGGGGSGRPSRRFTRRRPTPRARGLIGRAHRTRTWGSGGGRRPRQV